MGIDLRKCKPGDQLRARNNTIFIYVENTKHSVYPHVVRYTSGSTGSRTNDGLIFMDKPTGGDVVKILKTKRKPRAAVKVSGHTLQLLDGTHVPVTAAVADTVRSVNKRLAECLQDKLMLAMALKDLKSTLARLAGV